MPSNDLTRFCRARHEPSTSRRGESRRQPQQRHVSFETRSANTPRNEGDWRTASHEGHIYRDRTSVLARFGLIDPGEHRSPMPAVFERDAAA
jgi:hypothetical protein